VEVAKAMDDDTLTLIEHDLVDAFGSYLAGRRRRKRVIRLTSLTCALFVVTAAAAIAGAHVFGGPAPERVRSDMAAVDRGLPEDMRLNPDVEHAHAVAASGTATLYGASLRAGGYCLELVIADGPGRGAVCKSKGEMLADPIDVTIPTVDSGDTPVALGGRVQVSADYVELRYGSDGPVERIPFGEDRFFAFEVSSERAELARKSSLIITAFDQKGREVAKATIPSDWNEPPVPDEAAPLFVSTRSDESDFTKVFGIEGHVGAANAASLELDYGDGTSVQIPIDANGDYAYTVPPERTSSFMAPRRLVARDAAGKAVATAPVAAVAYWRGRERSP
jgi:hypothetical protein